MTDPDFNPFDDPAAGTTPKPQFTLMPGDGNQLIFVTEGHRDYSRVATWLVTHDNDDAKGDLSVLTDRDLTVARAFLAYADQRVGREMHRRHKEESAG